MFKRNFCSSILLGVGMLLFCTSCEKSKIISDDNYYKEELVDLINPQMGTLSEYFYSHGNLYPAIGLPRGMNTWTPQTNEDSESGWIYEYSKFTFMGLRQTHQPSPWIGDYGCFTIMPTVGNNSPLEKEHSSVFDHKGEISKPDYYKVYLGKYNLTCELTPTERCAQIRITYPQSDSSYVIIDGMSKGSMIKVLPDENKIIGYNSYNKGGVPDNFKNWFVIKFNKSFNLENTWERVYNKEYDNKKNKYNYKQTDIINKSKNSEIENYRVGATLRFSTNRRESILAKVASSFISLEQAEINLNREIGNDDFETTRKKARLEWNNKLSQVELEGPRNLKQTFYSTIFRCLLFPRNFYEFNQNNEIVHYSPYNGKVLSGYMHTDNGFWDTFRAQFPLLTILYPEFNSQYMQSLVNVYNESGWLPEWASPGHRQCMIGSNSASLIADSYLKGIRGYDIETLWNAIIKNTKSCMERCHTVGRVGADMYNDLGYVACDDTLFYKENSARTLEYAYADYCIYQLGKALGKPESEIKVFAKRAQNYRNVYDHQVGQMNGKFKNGNFRRPFDKFLWEKDFTEGCSLQYTWSVMHDPQGLIDLMGGDEIFISKLDSMFEYSPIVHDNRFMHEHMEQMTQNFGQYNHGNQPCQHVLYFYNWVGQPWKTQYWVRQVLNRLYSATPNGYCGDEDNGQTSAWFVMSSMGFYPVCPGSGEYIIGSPIFNKVTLNLENGKQFIISALNNTYKSYYVHDVKLNGKTLSKNYFTHKDLIRGGSLDFNMSGVPNKERGITKSAAPFSMSK